MSRTKQIEKAARALLDWFDKFGVKPGWGLHKDYLRAALALPPDPPGAEVDRLEALEKGIRELCDRYGQIPWTGIPTAEARALLRDGDGEDAAKEVDRG